MFVCMYVCTYVFCPRWGVEERERSSGRARRKGTGGLHLRNASSCVRRKSRRSVMFAAVVRESGDAKFLAALCLRSGAR